MASSGDLNWRATLDDSGFQAAMDRINASIQGVVRDSSAQSNALNNNIRAIVTNTANETTRLTDIMKQASVAAIGFFSIGQATQLIGEIVNTRGEFEKLEKAFGVMLQSKEKADTLMKEVVNFAATTPFDLQQVATGTKQLLAYGFAAEDMKKNLTMLGDVAAGVGSQVGDLIYLYGTLKASGRVTQMDINQFAGRGIPIYKALADTMGVAENKVRGLVSAGQIGFPQIEQAFESMAGVGGQFYNLMEEQSKTLSGQVSNLKDSFSQMLNQIGESSQGILTTGIQGVASVVANYKAILNVMAELLIVYGAYKAALIINNGLMAIQAVRIVGVTAAEAIHYGWLVLMEKVQWAYNAALAACPILLVTAGIAALGIAIYKISTGMSAAEEAQKRYNDAMADSHDKTVQQQKDIANLAKEAVNLNNTSSEREVWLQKLISISPEYFGKLKIEHDKIVGLSDAVRRYNDMLMLNASIKAEVDFQTAERAKKADLEKRVKNGEFIGAAIFSKEAYTGRHHIWERGAGALNYQEAQSKASDQAIAASEKRLQTLMKEQVGKDAGDNKNSTLHNKDFWEKEKQKQNTALAALSDIEAKGQKGLAIRAKIKAINDKLEAYSTKEGSGSSGKAAENKRVAAQKKADNQMAALLQEITNSESEAKQAVLANNSKVDSQQEKINKHYDDLLIKAQKLKAGEGVVSRIQNARATALGAANVAQENEKFLKDLEVQKEAYAKYEENKYTLGVTKAKEMYGVQYDSFKEYLNNLQSKTGEQQKAVDQARIDNQKQERDSLATLLVANQSYEQQKEALARQYYDQQNKLEGSPEAQEVLRRGYNERLKALEETHVKELDQYRALFEHIEELSWKEVKARKAALIEKLKAERAANLITEEEYKRSMHEVGQLAKDKEGANFELVLQRVQAVIDKLGQFNSGIASAGALLMQAAASYAAVLKGVSDYKEAKEKDDKAGQIAAGIGILGAGVSLVSAGFNYFKALKESRIKALKEIADFQQKVITGEQKYQATLRSRTMEDITNQRGKSRYSIILDQLEEIKRQAPAVQAAYDKVFATLQGGQYVDSIGYSHKTLLRKAKTWDVMASLYGSDYDRLEELDNKGQLKDAAKANFDNLKALREELKKAGVDAEKLKAELDEMLTGTSVNDLAKGLRDLFAEGKRSAADFGESFESIMRNAILSSFEARFLQDAMQPFYTSLADIMKAGTPDQIMIAGLKAQYEAIGADYANKFDAIQKITGLDLTKGKAGSGGGGSVGTIQRELTETTGSELLGLFRGQYDVTKRLHDTALQNLSANLQTAANTAATVNRLDSAIIELRSVVKNTTPPVTQTTARGAGYV